MLMLDNIRLIITHVFLRPYFDEVNFSIRGAIISKLCTRDKLEAERKSGSSEEA